MTAIKELIKEIKIDQSTCQLFLQEGVPLVEWDQQPYAFLWHLIQAVPRLSQVDQLEKFAEISNFYWKAHRFQFIESIPDYQKFYNTRIEEERKNPLDLFQYRLTDYKIFDVQTMHEPKIEKNQLIYFTYNKVNIIPYRVVCPFPYHLQEPVHYQILPILE